MLLKILQRVLAEFSSSKKLADMILDFVILSLTPSIFKRHIIIHAIQLIASTFRTSNIFCIVNILKSKIITISFIRD